MSFITSPGVIVPPLTAGGVAYGTGSVAKVTSAGTAGQVLTSNGAGIPTFQDSSAGAFGTDLSFEDYSLTLSSGISSSLTQIIMQAVSLDGTSELMIISGTSSAHAVVWNSSTSTFGTPILVRTASFTQAANNIALAKISSTSVLVSSLVVGSTALETVVLTVSGSTITVGTALATTLAANGTLVAPNTRLVAVGSSFVLNYFASTGGLPKFRAITVSGSTPSIGAELAYAGGTLSAMHHSYSHSASILLHFSMTASTTIFCLPISVSGTTLTAGTQATVLTNTTTFFATGVLDNSRYALFYVYLLGRGAVVSVTGTVASISTAVTTIAIGTTFRPAIQVFGNQAFLLFGNAGLDEINVLTDTAGIATLGTSLSSDGGGFVGFLNTGKVFLGAASSSTYYRYGILSGSPVLEKTFANVTINSSTGTVGSATYAPPLAGLPLSASGINPILLRTSAGKTVLSNTTSPFVASIDGTSFAELQQSANPLNSYNDGISEAVVWGIANAQAANTTEIQLRKVTLV